MSTTSELRDETSDVPEDHVTGLTRSAAKRDAYRVDPYFRLGHTTMSATTALATTFVVLKPEAVAGRRIPTVLTALRRNGFAVRRAATFTFTPLLTREIWRYQLNIATWARIELVDLVLPSSESLLLTLADTRWEPGALPAACRLAALKGPANPALRGPEHLRSLLRGPTTLLNFLHTADEPADVVRELALLRLATGLPAVEPDQDAAALAPDQLARIVDRLHDQVPAHDLDERASWARLATLADSPVAELARRAVGGDTTADWNALLDLFPDRRPPRHLLWDVLSIATAQIECNVPGLRAALPTMGAASWLHGEGHQ